MMSCILCEEPVRSVTIGLAAVGLVTIVRTAQKGLTSLRRNASADIQVDVAPVPAAVTDDTP